MASGIGIHLGCSSMCIAASKSGRAEVIANAGGERTTPAFVTISKEESSVGLASKQSSHRYPAQTVSHIIKLLGQEFEENLIEIIKNKSVTSCAIVEKDKKPVYEIPIGENNKLKQFSPSLLVTLLLKNALITAQTFVGPDVNEVVITVPENATKSFKDVLSNAVAAAGFEVLRLISTSTASALGYGIGFEEVESEPYNVLVVRIGGQTNSLTVLKVIHGMISVKASETFESGGDVLTEDLANHFASVFEQKSKCKITQNAKAMRKLKMHSEKCKQILSTIPTANCHIDSLFDGMDFNGAISRSRFEMLVSNHLKGFLEPIKSLLNDKELSVEDINKVILSGGTCNIPVLKKMIVGMLPNAEILSSFPPEEVSARGCALESALLSNQSNVDVKEEDVLIITSPGEVFLQIGDKDEEKVVSIGSVLPIAVEKKLNIEEIKLSPVLLSYKFPGENGKKEKIGEISMEKFSKCSSIDTCFKYLADGHISLTLSNEEESISEHITIKSA